jgi:flagellar protein FlgJ
MIENIASSALSSLPAATLPSRDNPAKIHDAAQQFESLLIGQLLKTSREADGGGWLGTDEDDAGQAGVEMGEQQFANMLAAAGGLGMAKLIEAGLKTESAQVEAAKGSNASV